MRVGLEIEFYLFERKDGDGASTATSDVGSYFDFSANDRGEEARNAIVAALRAMGVPIASAHHEHGAGQHEIDVAHDDPLAAADHALTLRTIAKHVAADFGLEATFMPKPLEERAGSGLHADFRSAESSDEETALYVVGGLLAHAPATTAICNPTVNSYKRLVAAWDAPIYAVWSERSANALVRVPPGQTPPRIEMRSPDPACNPYLALAVLIGAAADGVDNATLPGPALVGFDLRSHREGPPRARHPHAAEIATPSDRRARRRRRRARRARRSSLPRIPRRQARRIRTLPPRRSSVGTRTVPAAILAK